MINSTDQISQNWDRQTQTPSGMGFLTTFHSFLIRQGFCFAMKAYTFSLKRVSLYWVLFMMAIKLFRSKMKWGFLLCFALPSLLFSQEYYVGSHDLPGNKHNPITLPVFITNLENAQGVFLPNLEIRYNKSELTFNRGHVPPATDDIWRVASLSEVNTGTVNITMRLFAEAMVNPWDHFLELTFNWLNPGDIPFSLIEIEDRVNSVIDTVKIYYDAYPGVYPEIDGNDTLDISDVNQGFAMLENGGYNQSMLFQGIPVDMPFSLSKLPSVFQFSLGLKSSLGTSELSGKEKEEIALNKIVISDPIDLGGSIFAYTISVPDYENVLSADLSFVINSDIIDGIQSVNSVQAGALVRGSLMGSQEYRVQLVKFHSPLGGEGKLFQILAKHKAGETGSGLNVLEGENGLELLRNPEDEGDLHISMYADAYDVSSPDTSITVSALNVDQQMTPNFKITSSGFEWDPREKGGVLEIFSLEGKRVKQVFSQKSHVVSFRWNELPKGVILFKQTIGGKITSSKMVNPSN